MTPAMADALNADTILSLMQKSLSPTTGSEASSEIKDPYSAVAIFVHACMLAVGFRLLGLGEDHKIGMSSPRPAYLAKTSN